jgi:hypothetical protein
MIAVGVYWTYAIWAHTQSHLLVSVFVAPFLLLRSEKSTALAIMWFGKYDIWVEQRAERNFFGPRPEVFRWGVALIIAMVRIAGLFYAVLVRMGATARYPIEGVRALSRNWWRTLFATDLLSEPELIPDYRRESLFVYPFMKGVIQQEFRTPGQRRIFKGQMIFIFVFYVILVFGPAYIYRLSIKSTAWAHWPLGYITRPLRYFDDPDEIRARLWSDPREWVRRIFMILTFAGAIVATFPKSAELRQVFQTGPISVLEYVFLIDVKTLLYQPWRIVALLSALITLALTWYGAELSLLVRRGKRRPDRQLEAQKWGSALEYAMRVRDVCGWIFWSLVLTHALLWLLPSTEWLGDYPRELLQVIYGRFLPPSLRANT